MAMTSSSTLMGTDSDSSISREKWGNKAEFILSSLGCAVGLGNVWRFPYFCGRNGGAAFLIPCAIVMVFAGIPMYYLEVALGQYAGVTPSILFNRIAPIFAGVGPVMLWAAILCAIYYNVLIAWALRYLVASFTIYERLPWETCNNYWNSDYCYDEQTFQDCTRKNLFYFRGNCTDIHDEESMESLLSRRKTNFSQAGDFNSSIMMQQYWHGNGTNMSRISPAEEYLNKRVLKISGGLDEMGTPDWELCLCLFAAWVLVFCCLAKGIKTSGKVVYFTSTFPYLILLVLMIRGLTLPGAMKGIEFYVVPDMSRLKDGKVWLDAAIQVLFSLSVGWGGLHTLSSYNDFNNNVLRDTFIVALGDWFTSILAGFVIFPILGFMAEQTQRTVADIADSGPGLAFIAYPDALAKLPGAPFWAMMFFFMLVLLGISTQLVLIEVVITWIMDHQPSLRRWQRKAMVVGGICFVCFLGGIILTCPGGSYLLNLMDTFAGGWPMIVVCITELILVCYVYGLQRFIKDLRLMLGEAPNKWWKYLAGYPVNAYWIACWTVVTPLLLAAIQIFDWVSYTGITYADYEYPVWGQAVGWMMGVFVVMWIPIFAVYKLVKALLTGEEIASLFRPTKEWGPAQLVHGVPSRPHELSPMEEYLEYKEGGDVTGVDKPNLLIVSEDDLAPTTQVSTQSLLLNDGCQNTNNY